MVKKHQHTLPECKEVMMSWLTKIGRTIHLYIIYGIIITKNKGWSYYYDLLNNNAKTDEWSKVSLKLEIDFFKINLNVQFENTEPGRIH